MYAQVEKPKDHKSRAVANSVALREGDGKKGFGVVDNRPEAFVQRKRQESIRSKNVKTKCDLRTVRKEDRGLNQIV